MMSNNRGGGIVKEIAEIIMVNKDKKVKLRCKLKNKLIIFTYYLNLSLILSYIINLFY